MPPEPVAEPVVTQENEPALPPADLPDGAMPAEAEPIPTAEPEAPADRPVGGFFGRIPLLSSLLPPPRRHKGEEGGLPEWAVIAVILLLLSGERSDDDILPFLLLLLLWN